MNSKIWAFECYNDKKIPWVWYCGFGFGIVLMADVELNMQFTAPNRKSFYGIVTGTRLSPGVWSLNHQQLWIRKVPFNSENNFLRCSPYV